MDASRSKILCPLNSLFIQNNLLILANFSQISKGYKEENAVQFLRESLVEKINFPQSLLKI